MFNANWFSSLNSFKHKQHNSFITKSKLIALVCNGKTSLSDKECCLKDEINWLNKNKINSVDNYRALLCHCSGTDSMNSSNYKSVEPPLIIASNQNNQIGTLNQQVKPNQVLHPEKLNRAKIFMASSVNRSSEKKMKVNPPYTFHDRKEDVYFSMLIDNEPDDVNLLFRLSGFVDWLGLYKPELLFSKDSNNSEYLFHWLVYSIVENDNDILNGLFQCFNALSNHNIGGLFNILFSDGSGVYAYSNKEENHEGSKTISFKINRNEHNIFSYALRNSNDHEELDWIHLKANSLYYFPTQGPLQNYLNTYTPHRSEVKLNKCMYWNCLSLISANLI